MLQKIKLNHYLHMIGSDKISKIKIKKVIFLRSYVLKKLFKIKSLLSFFPKKKFLFSKISFNFYYLIYIPTIKKKIILDLSKFINQIKKNLLQLSKFLKSFKTSDYIFTSLLKKMRKMLSSDNKSNSNHLKIFKKTVLKTKIRIFSENLWNTTYYLTKQRKGALSVKNEIFVNKKTPFFLKIYEKNKKSLKIFLAFLHLKKSYNGLKKQILQQITI